MKSTIKIQRGSVLIVTLVALGFVVTVLFGVLRVSLQQRRQLRNEHKALQAQLLLDAGVRQMIHRIESDGQYLGESILIKENLGPDNVGQVTIDLRNSTQSDAPRVAKIVATVQSTVSQERVQRSHELVMPVTDR